MEKGPQQSDEEIARLIAEGGRLSVILNPDQEYANYANPIDVYWETYDLPHVCVQDGKVWGATRKTHLAFKPGEGLNGVFAFFYTNALPIYGITADETDLSPIRTGKINLRLLTQVQYDEVRFLVRPAGDLVWSGNDREETRRLQEAIHQGRKIRIVFTDEKGLLRSHPLDLCFFLPNSNEIKMMIEFQMLPEPFINPEAFVAKLRRSSKHFDEALKNQNFNSLLDVAAYPAFRRITETGLSEDPIQIMRQTSVQVSNIRLYAE